jgi:hypothetical protein
MKKIVLVACMVLICTFVVAEEAAAPPITGDQALKSLSILDQATSTFQGTRQQHRQIEAALMTLQTYINEHEPKEDAAKPME